MKNLNNILDYLNERFNQESEEYSFFNGAKQQVIRFDERTAISLWACGAIICVGQMLYFIQEDDESWFAPEYITVEDAERNLDFWKNYPHIGMQSNFNIGWIESFSNALKALNEYVKANGVPFYYANTKTICGYELK